MMKKLKTENIWEAFSSKLLGYIQSRVSAEEAPDILQNVFLKVHQNKHQLKKESSLPAWLFNITKNEITDFYRRNGRDEVVLLQDESEEKGYSGLSNCLAPFLDKLSADERELIELIDLQGKKQTDMAEERSIPYPSLKSRLQRTRKKLKTMFLECCDYSFDRRGRVMEMKSDKGNGAGFCGGSC